MPGPVSQPKLSEELLGKAELLYNEVNTLIGDPEDRLVYKSRKIRYFDMETSRRLDFIQAKFRETAHAYLDAVVDLPSVLENKPKSKTDTDYSLDDRLENIVNMHCHYGKARMDSLALVKPDDSAIEEILKGPAEELQKYFDNLQELATDVEAVMQGDSKNQALIVIPEPEP